MTPAAVATQAERFSETIRDLAPSLAGEAADVAKRLQSGRFEIAVVGEFNRGKTTLINALVGRPLLPTGVLPVTSVPTEVRDGPPGVTVQYLDGSVREAGLGELPALVTENGNPANRQRIGRVVVTTESDLLRQGVVITDTPGFASRHDHNSTVAGEAVAGSDAAILVLSATQPVSERDLALLDQLADVSVRTFVVVNRIDGITTQQQTEVLAFVADTLRDRGHDRDRLYPVAATAALQAATAGAPSPPGFANLRRDLGQLVTTELDHARVDAGMRDLLRLADRLETTLDIEQSALAMSTSELEQRRRLFREVVDEQQRRFAEDRAVLDAAITTIADAVYARLTARAADPPADDLDLILKTADTGPVARLSDVVDDLVNDLVRERYAAWQHDEIAEVAATWHDVTTRHLARVTAHSAELATAAEDLFTIRMRPPAPPEVTDLASDFYYDLTRSETTGEQLLRTWRRLLPTRTQRRQAGRQAVQRYRHELAKHAGRVRWDVQQRLQKARDLLVRSTREYLERMTDDVAEAASRAASRQAALTVDQQRWGQAAENARTFIDDIRSTTRSPTNPE